MNKRGILLLLGLAFVFSLFSCNKSQNNSPSVKYVFLFIGDGMGLNQAYITQKFMTEQNLGQLSFLQFPNLALTRTDCADTGKITDSGAGGTAIATGRRTQFHAIGMDRKTGRKFKSIAEIARDNGWKVGLISSVGMNHATPACFYAHVPQRSMYNEIARQMWHSGFDFFGGGGLITKGNRDSLLKVFYDSLRAAGYKIVFSKEHFFDADNQGKKLYLMDTASLDGTAMYYMIDSLSRVSLADFTKAAIKYLYNPKGFFLMVEGGKIDWACHANDVATEMYEVMDFDKAIQVALDFYKKHPNQTLIIVTADHETGGLSLGYNDTHYDTYLYKLKKQWRSKAFINSALSKVNPADYPQVMAKYLKIDTLPKPASDTKPGTYVNSLIDNLQHQAGIGWTTHSHTGTMIPTYAIGPGANNYHGIIDNTYSFDVIKKVTGLK